jgi:signal transduction histidine kinase/ActR/RegA family two-component response regulator
MPLFRLISIITFFCFFHSACFSQKENISHKQLEKKLIEAGNQLYKLDYNKSLITANEVLTQAYKKNDNRLIARAYNIIGLDFSEFSDFKKTISFFNKALYYAYLTKDDSVKDWIYNNLGNVYTQENVDFKKGIEYYKKGLFFSEKNHDLMEAAVTKLNIASAYFEIKDFKQGIQYLNPIKKVILKKGDLESRINLNSLFGDYYKNLNKIDSSIAYYNQALILARNIKDEIEFTEIINTYTGLSDIYIRKGDYKKAVYYLLLKNDLNEKFNNAEKLKKAKIIGSKIEIDDYIRKIEKIEFEKKMQANSLKFSKIIVGLLIVSFIALLLLLYSFYKNIVLKRKNNEDLMNINLALTDAKEKAEESALLKSQFISTISHELRTPLYGVVGITNMLVDDHKELAESPHLNSLKFSARYLLSLVNDILQINKIDEKKITLENETFNIHEELNIIVHSLKFLANKNENSIYVEVDANIPKLLIGDKLRLAQIIMNLGSNALKFTNEGKVIIRVVQTNIINNWHYIQFQVIDNGIGIAKSDQEKIYDKFVQVGKKVHDYQGTGLGLSIVKKLIELFNSQIYVTSDVNVGTTFTFTIAFKAGEDKVVETSVISETNLTTNHSIKVLVVEDNKINQIVTKKIIEKNNFECEVVDNGIIALERLESESYDVILMDINMPIINGFETTRQIREKGILIPVIALTAFDRDEITDEAYSSGMNDIIIKPFEPIKAFQIINAEVNKYKSNI